MAFHVPTTGAPSRAPANLSPFRREAIESEIELHLQRVDFLIRRLDRADAPFEDLEDDDPAGDALDEHGECPTDDGTQLLGTLPLYAADQTAGPINERAAVTAWQRSL